MPAASLVSIKGTVVGATHRHSSSTLRSRAFRKGHASMIGSKVQRAIPFPVNVVLDIQFLCTLDWATTTRSPDWMSRESLLFLHGISCIGASNSLHWLGMPRPGEYFRLTWGTILEGDFGSVKAAAANIPECVRIQITHRTKTDVLSAGSTRWLTPASSSGVHLRLWLHRLRWTSWMLKLSMSTNSPVFQRGNGGGVWTSADFWNYLMKPVLERIKRGAPGYVSSTFLANADPSYIAWRSYRRGAFQAMRRRSEISPIIRDFMMRWSEGTRASRSNGDIYDDLLPEDTIQATFLI